MEAEGGDVTVAMEFSELEGMLRPILAEAVQVRRACARVQRRRSRAPSAAAFEIAAPPPGPRSRPGAACPNTTCPDTAPTPPQDAPSTSGADADQLTQVCARCMPFARAAAASTRPRRACGPSTRPPHRIPYAPATPPDSAPSPSCTS